jgi:hypothetical protein
MQHLPYEPTLLSSIVNAACPDDFELPEWVVYGLIEQVILEKGTLATQTCWDPCCRRGHIAAALRGYFGSVQAAETGPLEQDAHDFLKGRIKRGAVDWIITQPPRGRIEPFVLRDLQTARPGVAILVHTPVHGSLGPRLKLFEKHPPTVYAPLGCTVPLPKAGTPDLLGQTASFTWLVWRKGEMGPSKLTTIPGAGRHEKRDELSCRSGSSTLAIQGIQQI